jgi:uncharacterized membrane protein
LLLGVVILLRPKGTTTHFWTGRAYLAVMICLNVSALDIYHLTGGFNIFHVLAVLNLAIILIGISHFLRRTRPRKWLWRHYHYMAWSYVGLLAATINEALVRVPGLDRLTAATNPWLPLAAMAVLMGLSALVIFSRQRSMLDRYGRSE